MLFVGSNGRIIFLLILPLSFIPIQVWSGIACLSNPCMHGVCLDDLNSSYFCYCIDGYTGIQCQTNWNECWSSPCQNGGICIDGIAAFNCTCPPGFVGELCEEDFNECESNPCLNNGTCLDAPNGYICNCLPGYSGLHCELDVAVCNATNETRCSNGGICIEGPGDTFFCNCQPGWEGFLCETETDECLATPCKNGGLCMDLMADYSCACLFGFAGRNCEERVRICEANPCSNGALCIMEDHHPVCYCVPDFHGDLCQSQYDECQLGPKCLNGGTCIDGIDNSTCSCPPNLTGVQCECLILDENKLDCTYTRPEITTYKTTTTETEVPNITTIEPLTTTGTVWKTTTEVVPVTITTETPIETTAQFSTTPKEMETITTTEKILTTETEEATEIWTMTSFYNQTVYMTTETSFFSTDTTSPKEQRDLNTTSSDFSTTEFSSVITSVVTKEPDITTPTVDITTEILETSTIIVFDCTKTSCQNGGTCIYLENKYNCICPFDTEGETCEMKLGVQKASFMGNSYLQYKLDDSPNITIELEAKTLASKGLIFYATRDSTYMLLYVEDGHLKFKFSCGYQTMLLSELKVLVSNGDLMKIKAKLDFSTDFQRCDASIKINNTLSMTGDQMVLKQRFVKPQGWLYLGGVPLELLNNNLLESGFIGCISTLKISGKNLDLFKDAEDGVGVTECSSLACLSNPCQNGGSCKAKGDEWSCICKNGFLGKMCEKSVCDNNPCLFGGTCISFSGSGYICLCPYGKHGHFCENDLKITKPTFASSIRGLSSYVAYPIPGGISETMQIQFKFTPSTMDQISILLFIGQKGYHDYYSDHMAVSFVKGYIMLTWNLGSGPRRIFTAQQIQEGPKNYLVQIGRTGRRAWLSVDNLGNVTGRSPGSLVQLDVSPILYLGGHSSKNFSTLPHDLPLHTGFSGCIFDVELISGNVLIPLQSSRKTIGRAVGQCGTTECYEQSCQNNGICLHHASTFMCLCQDDWFGPLCTYKTNPCDENKHKCSSGSTCVPIMADYECDCPIGKTGKHCDTDEEITDVSFSGKRSYLSLPGYELVENKFNIEVELRTLADNGLIFYAGKNKMVFVSLTLQSGFVELKVLPSFNKISVNEPITVTSSKMLVKGIWYKIRFGIFGRKAYVSVNNVITTGVLTSENGVDISKEIIYFGGLPDMSTLPLLSISSFPIQFKGCIRYFSVNSIQTPLNKKTILNGRNIKDCDGTPCGKDVCLNGGTCWLDSFMKPHCACASSYFGTHCENVSECSSEKCKNNGQCMGSKCSCHIGWEGVYCETKINVTSPEFSGRSYVLVRKMNEKKRDISDVHVNKLFLNFTTVAKNGLLLWSRKGKTFVGIGTENGFLKIVYTQNSKVVTLPFNYRISDGLWHDLDINFSPFSIKLDQNKLSDKEQKGKLQNISIETDGLFYIGGIPTKTSIRKETNGTFVNAFEGCIDSFAPNGEQVIRDFSNFEGRNINICKIL